MTDMKRVPLHGTQVDNSREHVLDAKAQRIGNASMHMLDVMINSEALGIDLGVVVAVWREESGLVQALPTFMAADLGGVPTIVRALRAVADRIEAGEYAPPTTAKGGDG